jgi:uncharacterized membrane protein YecN with MAPEG domain
MKGLRMPLGVTALYGALLALVGLVLGGLVGSKRPKLNVSLGDGGHRSLIEANRRHMNWVENVPVLIVLMAIIELNGASSMWLHVMGGTLLAGRVIHPFGIDATNMRRIPRFVGASLTILVALGAIGTLLWQHFR